MWAAKQLLHNRHRHGHDHTGDADRWEARPGSLEGGHAPHEWQQQQLQPWQPGQQHHLAGRREALGQLQSPFADAPG